MDERTQKQHTCVDDVRQVREQLSNQFDNNVYKLGEHLRKIDEQYRQQLDLKTSPPVPVGGKSQST